MSPATLDLIILGALLLFAVAGAISGALRQVVQLAAVVAGWLAARHLAPWLAPRLLGSGPPPWQRSALAVACFLAGAALVGLVGALVARRLHGPGGSPGALDRGLGALLGGAKAGLVAWVLLSALALAGGPLVLGPLRLDARGSDFGSLAARHNLLTAAAPAQARALQRLLEATRDPAARQRLLERDPGIRRLLDDPRFQALLERPAWGDEPPALTDPELKALLERLEPE